MSEKKRIVEAMKHRMKTQGVTYAKMAERIGVSEATIKRYLSSGRFTLDTLDAMCGVLQVSLEELLVEYGEQSGASWSRFSLAQEKVLAENELLFAIFYTLGGGYDFTGIMAHFEIGETALIRQLVELDRLELIDYRSNDNIRLCKPTDTQWIPSGPLWKKYTQQGVAEFFSSEFSEENEYLKVSVGPISPETAAVIRRRLVRLDKEIQEFMATEDIPANDISSAKRYWFITAMRPMTLSALSKRAVAAAMQRLLGKQR